MTQKDTFSTPVEARFDASSITVNRFIIALAWVGLFVASFLTMAFFMNKVVPCGGSGGCTAVTNHPSGKWLGIPVSAFGVVAYATILGLALVRAMRGLRESQSLVKVGLLLSSVGTLASMYLMFTAFFVIRETCLWCITSAVIMTLLMLLHATLAQKNLAPQTSAEFDLRLSAVMLFLALGGIGFGFNQLRSAATLAPTVAQEAKQFTPEMLAGGKEFFKGPEDAPITIVEYADFYCATCRQVFPEGEKVFQAFPGKIRWGFINYPLFKLKGHELSVKASAATLIAAEKGKYWLAVERLFAIPDEQIKTMSGLLAAMVDIGLDSKEVEARLASGDPKLLDALAEVQSRALKMGVDRTPTFIIFAKGVEPKVASMSLEETLNAPEYRALLKGTDGR